jgi:serine/threonine-protein kinase PRP4
MDRLDRERGDRDRERDGKRRAEREREDKERAEREKVEKERQAKIAAEEEARYRARVEAALKETAPGLLESEEDDEDEEERERRLAEERRKRREAIMAKHRATEPPEGGDAPPPSPPRPAKPPIPSATAPDRPDIAPSAAASDDAPDMFADDMFDDEAEERAAHRMDRTAEVAQTGAADMTAGLSDNWDDAEGYYRARMGEVLDGRYQVMESHGRGVFSTVVKAKDLAQKAGVQPQPPIPVDVSHPTHVGEGEYSEVALKVIRANETMYKAAQLEITVLKKLMDADPENKRHCVRFLRSFEFRDHVFMVFESMHMNLREVIKKYGRDVGLNVHGVRSFATQMLIALRHLKNCGVVHADIKPDNILVNKSHNVIKICDFGSAMFDGDNEITPYLQSRFYRAPEVILGLPYSHPMDLWSIGCCLYELYMGKIAFQGRSNNEMMKKLIEAK